ncbi:hypothetical protein [Endozoicomonas sp. ALC066]|uniref:hypothetical protein n=1 Tax=Endozoicomonas sp. ALC066 TaxID=3403078 RepID=UPI003BB7E073
MSPLFIAILVVFSVLMSVGLCAIYVNTHQDELQKKLDRWAEEIESQKKARR